MSTSIVSSVMLLDRRNTLSEEELLKKAQWVYHEINARDGHTGLNVAPSQ